MLAYRSKYASKSLSRVPSGASSSPSYLPESTPAESGEYGRYATSWWRIASTRPTSSERCSSEYEFCTETGGGAPSRVAAATNSLTPSGVSLESPHARTLPDLTSSPIARACSSKETASSRSLLQSYATEPNIGTYRSGQWICSRSRWSTPRRASDASTDAMICSRVTRVGPSRIHVKRSL